MLKALLVDDEPKARDVLAELLRQYVPEITELREAGSPGDALLMMERFNPDLLFLDIIMPQMNGFDLLNRLEDRRFGLIFTTAYNQFAIQAIRFSALDYLLKPIDPDELRQAVDRFLEKKTPRPDQPQSQLQNMLFNLETGQKEGFRLAVPTTEGVFFYPIREIIRCEASSNYTQFYLTQKRSFIASKTLKEYDEILTPQGFVRVHKSHLVNIAHAEDYLGKGFILLKDQSQIEVARRRRDAVLEALKRKSPPMLGD